MKKDEIMFNGNRYVKKNYIDIPKNINLDKNGDLLFNNKRQKLFVSKIDGVYNVDSSTAQYRDYSDNFCLMRCDCEDLEPGDTAFHADSINPCFTHWNPWCKILDDETYAYRSGTRDVITYRGVKEEKYWWKVVRKDEVLNDE